MGDALARTGVKVFHTCACTGDILWSKINILRIRSLSLAAPVSVASRINFNILLEEKMMMTKRRFIDE